MVAAAFYLFDTALLGIYALLGVVPLGVPIAFFLAGGVLYRVWRLSSMTAFSTARHVEHLDAIVQGGGCVIYLATALLYPQVGFLALMSVGNLTASTAIRLRTALMVALLVPIALFAVAIAFLKGSAMSAPLDTTPQTVVAALWIAASLFRGAFINRSGLEVKTRIGEANEQLTEALAKIEEIATRDELTGLPNRRSLQQLMQDKSLEDARRGSRLAVAVLDIDHFKRVNDTFGHAIGDAVLRRFAQALQSATRRSDRVGRWGGEEFLLLAVDQAGDEGFQQVAERLRAAIEASDWSSLAAGLRVTASIGITTWKPDEPASAALERADALLYEAKAGGRNCVRFG